jgi:hypothetical protein
MTRGIADKRLRIDFGAGMDQMMGVGAYVFVGGDVVACLLLSPLATISSCASDSHMTHDIGCVGSHWELETLV